MPLSTRQRQRTAYFRRSASSSRLAAEYDLIVIGGSALLALGLVSRSTQDIDVVALTGSEGLDEALPSPEPLIDARARVARDLTVRYASRLDQIHFKLHATVDQSGGKHFSDLQALEPSQPELLVAARWTRTHDPSEGFLSVLTEVLAYPKIEDADLSA
jgi:uncharacterized nucleotidyltransferase DUF6036